MAHTVHRVHQIGEESFQRFSVYFNWFLQRLIFIDQPEDTPVLIVPVRVPYIMLHVSNDRILPIGHIEGTILAENSVSRPKVLITT